MFRYLVCCAFAFVLACSVSLRAQNPYDQPRNPNRGVRVIEVIPGGQAERAGIKVMDLLSKYGKFEISDHSSYYKAREFYLKNPKQKVKVVFWRDNERMVIEVFPGQLGVDTNELNTAAYQLDAAIKSIEILRELPVFMRDVEFKEEYSKEKAEERLTKARTLLDQAEAGGTLSPTQILVARIRMIPDDAPVDEQNKQEQLVAEFTLTQPAEYISYLGLQLVDQGHFRPARLLLKHYLLADPVDDLSVRLELGYVCLNLGLWNEAEAAADLVLIDPDRLDQEELQIAYQQKASGALNRGDVKTCFVFAEKAFAMTNDVLDLLLMQLAAATAGDVQKFNEVSARFKELRPQQFEGFKLQIDSAEALALAVSGQDEAARAVIARWSQQDRVEAQLRHYWDTYPSANKVIENWVRLSTGKN